MGGFAADALSKLAEHGEELFDRGVSSAEGSKLGRGVLNLAGNQSWEMGLTDGGKAIAKMHGEYIRQHEQALQGETQKLAAIKEWHQNTDAVRNAAPIKSATAVQLHQLSVAHNAPGPIQSSLASYASDPETMGMTHEDLLVRAQKVARLHALSQSYGPHFENATPIIARMLQHPDPRVVANAHRVADIISNQVRDTRPFTAYGKNVVTTTEQSAAKSYMNAAFASANKVAKKAGFGKQIPLLNTEKTYTAPTNEGFMNERAVHRVLNTMLIPFVALNHIGQFFNLPASSPAIAIGKALFRMDHASMKQTVDASGIVASTMWSSMYRDILGETGHVADWTGSPDLGKLLARSIHNPGMSTIRKFQLNTAGSVGFHSAIYWAHNFFESGSKIAEARLREMEIDPQDVLSQKGQLNTEQLQKGVFHFVNNRMFFSRGVDNSLYYNRNVFTRAAYMYHSFVGSQMAYMGRELLLMAKAGDIKGIAQFAGTLAVLFPFAAPLIGGAEKFLHTFSAQQAAQQTEQEYATLVHPSNAGAWIGNYFDLLSHLGAAGVYFNYINAIKANRLASAVAGPIVGATTTDITDAYHAAFMPNKHGRHNFAPIERDLLKQTVPVFGSALAHEEAPTAAEERATHPHLPAGENSSLRIRGFSRRRRY